MKKLLLLLAFTLSFLISYPQYYVSNDSIASDNNPGTIYLPFKTWNKGFQAAQPGDTVYFRSGVYMSEQRVGMQPWTGPRFFSHYSRDSVVFMGYPPDVAQGNYPILDCSLHKNIPVSPYNPRYNSAISLLKGISIKIGMFSWLQ